MKKLLTLAAAGFLGLSAFAQTAALVPEDRSGWTITGCSEENSDESASTGDAGFDEIKDGDASTKWHSTYTTSGYSVVAGSHHYFVIDRGQAATSTPIDAFSYQRRQGGGNGVVTQYRLFVVNDITGLNTVHNTAQTAAITDNHASLTSFISDKTPVADGTFDYSDAASADKLKIVELDQSCSGRYVLFVIDAGEGGHATCAEFYLYQKLEGTLLNFKRSDGTIVASSINTLLADGTTITCPSEIGSGSGTISVGTSIDFTINDNVNPFKLVSARSPKKWAKSTAEGMATTPNNGSYSDGSWYLEVPQTNGGFKIFSVDNFKFQKSHTGDLASPAPLAEAADGSDVGVFIMTRDDSGAEKIRTFDDNTGFNIQGNNVGYWTQFDAGSLWFMVYDEDAYLTNKSSYSPLTDEIYPTPNSLFKQAYTAAKALQEEFPDDAALNAAIDKAAAARFGKAGVNVPNIIAELTTAYNALATSMPEAGHFYRFQCADVTELTDENNKGKQLFISSNHVNGYLGMIAENSEPNKVETVFYLDENNRLVALSDGLCLGKFTRNDTESWATLLATNQKASQEIRFVRSSSIAGKFIIEASSGRHLYGIRATVNVGGGDSEGYRWTISQVDWLPIPGSDQAYATITSPVALSLRDKVTAYKATAKENGRVELTAIAGNVIPANTPVVLHFETGVERNSATGLVYLQVTTGGEANASDLKGSYLATAKESGKQYAILNGAKFSALAADANVPGFKAHLEVSDAANHSLTTAAIDNIIDSGKVYSIKNKEELSVRGYIYHKTGEDGIWATSKAPAVADPATASATDANYHWTVISDNSGKYYLYNLGAQKFASAFTKPGTGDVGNAEFCWVFSDEPTAVEIQAVDWNPGADIFNIFGGQNNASDRPAGMMIIQKNINPVAGVSGVNPQDGNGFIFTEITGVERGDVPTAEEIESIKAEMIAGFDAATSNCTAWNETDATTAVGYYTLEGINAYRTAIEAVDETADAEAKHYAVVRAQIAAGDKYNKFVANSVYNVEDAERNFYRANITKNEDNTYTTSVTTEADFSTDEATFNWLATVTEAGVVSLSHSFETEEAAAPATRAAGDNLETVYLVQDATPAYDGFGKVTLGENLVVRASLRSDNPDTTTGIEEISLDSKAGANNVIYDLQGRRVSKAVKGVYIINGKKVLVK